MPDLFARFKRLFRLRFAVFYPLAVYLAFFTHPDADSMRACVLFMVAGLLLRLWANGYAIKMDKLTIAGPYAFVRNPLYVGTWLIMFGVAVMLKILVVGVIFFAVLFVVYRRTICKEEKMLADKFGDAYLDYRARVPAFWPTFTPYRSGEKWGFSWQRLWQSREHKVALWVGIIMIGFYFKAEFIAGNEPSKVKSMFLAGIAVALALIDLVGEYVRSRQKKG